MRDTKERSEQGAEVGRCWTHGLSFLGEGWRWLTMFKMAARTKFGSEGHASITRARSASIAADTAEIAPDFAALVCESAEFPAFCSVYSCPLGGIPSSCTVPHEAAHSCKKPGFSRLF